MTSQPLRPFAGRLSRLLVWALFAVTSSVAHADPAAREVMAVKHYEADERRRAADKPFEFRGIPLGITLDEFRAGSTVRATPVGSVPICETDVLAGSLGMSLKTGESLTVACRWAHRSAAGWTVSQAVVDGAPAEDHVLRFARANQQSGLRLFEISFVINEVTAGDLRNALAARYGEPRLVTKTDAPANGALPVYVWENAVSSITLCFLPSTHNGTLTYLLKDPDAWMKSLVRQWQASSAEAG
jgi:hypothetical protein